jgi:hypothetical protein
LARPSLTTRVETRGGAVALRLARARGFGRNRRNSASTAMPPPMASGRTHGADKSEGSVLGGVGIVGAWTVSVFTGGGAGAALALRADSGGAAALGAIDGAAETTGGMGRGGAIGGAGVSTAGGLTDSTGRDGRRGGLVGVLVAVVAGVAEATGAVDGGLVREGGVCVLGGAVVDAAARSLSSARTTASKRGLVTGGFADGGATVEACPLTYDCGACVLGAVAEPVTCSLPSEGALSRGIAARFVTAVFAPPGGAALEGGVDEEGGALRSVWACAGHAKAAAQNAPAINAQPILLLPGPRIRLLSP